MKIVITSETEGLSHIHSKMESVSNKQMPKTTKAFQVSSQMLVYTWKQFALGNPIPGTSIKVKHPTGAYARSIQSRMLSPFMWDIFSTSEYANILETGHDIFDLKNKLPYGKRSRVGKNGPYLIVPFRHGTTNESMNPMGTDVYQSVKQLLQRKSKVLEDIYKTPNASGNLVERRTYSYGDRLTNTIDAQLDGMLRFNVPSGTLEKRTEYITFRVISANPPKKRWKRATKSWENSWVVPSFSGYHLTEHTVRVTQNIIENMIDAAIKEDLGVQ